MKYNPKRLVKIKRYAPYFRDVREYGPGRDFPKPREFIVFITLPPTGLSLTFGRPYDFQPPPLVLPPPLSSPVAVKYHTYATINYQLS